MKYVGSKRRIIKQILPLILKRRRIRQWYVEPFCGGCNSLEMVGNPRLASDHNKYVIELFRRLQDGWVPPPHISEKLYNQVKKYRESRYTQSFVGYVGFNSYGAKFFGGCRRDKEGRRDYWAEHQRHLLRQIKKLQGVLFVLADYRDLDIPPESIIYCDPPYQHTLGYGSEFDHQQFWDWCRVKKGEGHSVFVSEYSAPNDFRCIWSQSVCNTLAKDTGSKRGIEKLFTLV